LLNKVKLVYIELAEKGVTKTKSIRKKKKKKKKKKIKKKHQSTGFEIDKPTLSAKFDQGQLMTAQ